MFGTSTLMHSAFIGVFLRPCVSDTVLGLCTGLLLLRRGFVDAASVLRFVGGAVDLGFSVLSLSLLLLSLLLSSH